MSWIRAISFVPAARRGTPAALKILETRPKTIRGYRATCGSLPIYLSLFLLLLFTYSGSNAQSNPALAGVVTDPRGSLIPDAVVVLRTPNRLEQTHADGLGHFAFTNASPGKYILEASGPGFQTRTVEGVLTGSHDTHIVSLALDVAIAGQCPSTSKVSYAHKSDPASWELAVKVLGSKRPLAKAIIFLTGIPGTGARSVPRQRTNSDGEYRFEDLEDGQYEIEVFVRGYESESTGSFWIAQGSQITVVVELLKKGKIRICQ